MHPFEAYLKEQNLEALTVSIKARVRYMTIYNATKGIPITPQHAQQIRHAVFSLTGAPYTGMFTLTEPEVEDVPTIQIKRLPRSHLN